MHPADEIQAVTFPDNNLDTAIRQALGKLPRDRIMASELTRRLTILVADRSDIRDISGLEYCIGLTALSLERNRISDISPLSSLTNLTELGLSRTVSATSHPFLNSPI